MPKGTCPVDERGRRCGRPVEVRGWCSMHYSRWRRTGTTDTPATSMPVEVRFWAKVDKQGPFPPDPYLPNLGRCWLWTAATDKGYGRFGKTDRAYVWAYEHLVGPVPDGLDLDHLCRVPLCVRPSHLEPVTRQENLLRGRGITATNARKTHCKRGHEFTPENTWVARNGTRHCKRCSAEQGAARRKKARYS